MGIQLYRFRWNSAPLETRLAEFVGGQCKSRRREERDGDYIVRRGEILGFKVWKNIKRVRVHFNWLCRQHTVFDKTKKPWRERLKWSPIPPLIGPPGPDRSIPQLSSYLDIDFTSSYYEPDEGRLKMWGGGYGEVCRFFPKEDHTNLVQVAEDEYVEQCIFRQLNLWRAIMIALRQPK